MGHKIHVEASSLKELKVLCSNENLKELAGIIIGQPLNDSTYVTAIVQTKDDPDLITAQKNDDLALLVADHAVQATRMLPGGQYVIGAFFKTKEKIIKATNLPANIAKVLKMMRKRLEADELMFGNNPNSMEQLVLFVSGSEIVARTYNSVKNELENADVVALSAPAEMILVSCIFDLNEVMYLMPSEEFDMEHYFQNVLSGFDAELQEATYIFDGSIRAPDGSLDDATIIDFKVNVDILIKNAKSTVARPVMNEVAGSVKMTGLISSMVWLHVSTKWAEAERSVREDIVRSLAARFKMHYDSLTEGEGVNYLGPNSIHELPKRMAITPLSGIVLFTDYLFPGESTVEPETAKILDLDASKVKELEGQLDLAAYEEEKDVEEQGKIVTSDPSKRLFYISAAITILILLTALIVQITF